MEALTAVSVALLTVWDMTKQYEKDADGQYPSTAIENIHVVKKLKQSVTQMSESTKIHKAHAPKEAELRRLHLQHVTISMPAEGRSDDGCFRRHD